MALYFLWWFLIITLLLKPAANHYITRVNQTKKDEKHAEIPAAANRIGSYHLNLNVEFVPVSLAPAPEEEFDKNEPYFDTSLSRNVTAYVGKTAYLTCRVFNNTNRTISWIRHQDTQILSVGTYLYTSNQRIVALHDEPTDEWTLIIKWVTIKDKGMYSCQLNGENVKNYYIALTVVSEMPSMSSYPADELENENNTMLADVADEIPVEDCQNENQTDPMLADVADAPTAYIIGDPDIYVSVGSPFNLTCILEGAYAQIFWYHNDEILNYDSLRGGITVLVERGERSVSVMHLRDTNLGDTGNYTCSPSNANSASTYVHVIEGNKPVAVMNEIVGANGNSTDCAGEIVTLSCKLLIAVAFFFMVTR